MQTQLGAQRIKKVADHIRQHSDDSFTLASLAEISGLSPYHFQRTFKAVMGVTPKQFAESCRVASFKESVRAKRSITDALYDAGFGSSSRLYEKVDRHLGMTPAQYRKGGQHVTISYVTVACELGWLMMGATDRGLCFVQFADDKAELERLLRAEYPAARLEPMQKPYPEQFESWMEALRQHLAGTRPQLDLPLDLRATAFQMKVWRYLQTIPYGEVTTYSKVAAGLQQPTAVRAVAAACAKNRVGLVIPCHRVIRESGELAGYRWGLHRKRALLEAERQHAS